MPTSAQTLAGGKKQATIEFWRFAFTALVVVYHLEVNYAQRGLLMSGVSAVEFFFILSGFLMAKSAYGRAQRHPGPTSVREAHVLALDFVKKKLKAIYPILIIVVIAWAISIAVSKRPPAAAMFSAMFSGTPITPFMAKLTTILNTEYVLLLLVGTPSAFMGTVEAIPMWFLTALLVIGYLYTFVINKRYDIIAFLAPALGILCWIFFALSVDPYTGGILDSSAKAGFMTAGMVKAISELSFGVCVFMLYNYLTKKNLTRIWRVLLSLLEIYAIARFCMLTFNQPIGNQNYVRLVYIMIIVLCSFLNVTWIARLLNRSVFRWLGSISLAMYICHYYLKDFYVLRFMKILQNYGATLPGSMKTKDALLYLLLSIVAATLITLLIWAAKRFVVRPLAARAKEKQSALAAVGNETVTVEVE